MLTSPSASAHSNVMAGRCILRQGQNLQATPLLPARTPLTEARKLRTSFKPHTAGPNVMMSVQLRL